MLRLRELTYVAAIALATKAPIFDREQQRPCTHRDSAVALLRPANQVYVDAISLADTLRRVGIAISCVLESKLNNMFVGSEGAAFYRTDVGDIDAVLLPPSRDFSKLRISASHSGRSWIYTFAGEPRMSGVPRW